MKANETPMKIYLNPDAVPHNQSGNFLFIHNSDIDESKCTIEYTRTDVFIEKAKEFLWEHIDGTDYHVNYILKEFEKYIRGE